MSFLILLNDVETVKSKFLIGQDDVELSVEGKKQAEKISTNFHAKLSDYDIKNIYTHKSKRTSFLIHKLKCCSNDLSKVNIKYLTGLNERNFGKMTGSEIDLSLHIFSHYFISPESGESVNQFFNRVKKTINSIDLSDSLIVAYPFVCQIIWNYLTSNLYTQLDDFWINQKGSCVLFDVNNSSFKIKEQFSCV